MNRIPLRFFLVSTGVCAALVAPMARAQQQAPVATFGTVIGLGGTPSDIVLDELRGKVYLINNTANRVDILGTAQNAIVGSIPVGLAPLAGAISMDGAFLYVTNSGSSSLSVIDLSTDTVAQTVTLPAAPQGVAVGSDGRALISTGGTGTGNPPANTLLIFDRTQQNSQQLFPVQTPPPASTTTTGNTTLVRPQTPFNSKLLRAPDGQFIVGLTTPGASTYMFVYEVASGVILNARTVAGQSTVLSMAPDGSRFMAGFTMYDTQALTVIAQQNIANAPFSMTGSFNTQQNVGGSAFSPDGSTLYSAFNTSQFTGAAITPAAATLLISDSSNLGIHLGINLPESLISKLAIASDGSNAWGLSQSGVLYLPLSTLYNYPILQPESTTVFLSVDPCHPSVATGAVRVNNLGKGKLTINVPNTGTPLIAQISSGLAPATITFTMEPGRAGATRIPGTNLTTGSTTLQGSAFNVNLTSLEAINIPNNIRVYMNYRQSDQRGVVYPIPTTPNNSPSPNQAYPNGQGNEGLWDLLLDEPRGVLYLTNSGYNRIEVFDINQRQFLSPIPVGQLPHQMAMSTDGSTLYVGNTGGESIQVVDLNLRQVTGSVQFPPLPRQGGGTNANPAGPRALAMGLSGLQFVMSNGTQWQVVGSQATLRPADTITPSTLAGAPNYTMVASPDSRYILTLAGTGSGYLFDALANTYVAGSFLFNLNPIESFYGPLAAAPSSGFLLANGLILNSSLTVIGGAQRPGATQPSAQTAVAAGQRNVAAVAPLSQSQFARITTPVRQNLTTATRDDPRPTLELVDITTGAETLAGPLAEQPVITVQNTQRWNVGARQMAVDSQGTMYAITLSGLTVAPIAPATDLNRPKVSSVVNAADGSATLQPGSFITISGSSLAAAASAQSVPAPTVLGGSCVTFNGTAAPLLQTSAGQIQAQAPDNLGAGVNVMQVRSLDFAQSSDPVMVNVQK